MFDFISKHRAAAILTFLAIGLVIWGVHAEVQTASILEVLSPLVTLGLPVVTPLFGPVFGSLVLLVHAVVYHPVASLELLRSIGQVLFVRYIDRGWYWFMLAWTSYLLYEKGMAVGFLWPWSNYVLAFCLKEYALEWEYIFRKAREQRWHYQGKVAPVRETVDGPWFSWPKYLDWTVPIQTLRQSVFLSCSYSKVFLGEIVRRFDPPVRNFGCRIGEAIHYYFLCGLWCIFEVGEEPEWHRVERENHEADEAARIRAISEAEERERKRYDEVQARRDIERAEIYCEKQEEIRRQKVADERADEEQAARFPRRPYPLPPAEEIEQLEIRAENRSRVIQQQKDAEFEKRFGGYSFVQWENLVMYGSPNAPIAQPRPLVAARAVSVFDGQPAFMPAPFEPSRPTLFDSAPAPTLFGVPSAPAAPDVSTSYAQTFAPLGPSPFAALSGSPAPAPSVAPPNKLLAAAAEGRFAQWSEPRDESEDVVLVDADDFSPEPAPPPPPGAPVNKLLAAFVAGKYAQGSGPQAESSPAADQGPAKRQTRNRRSKRNGGSVSPLRRTDERDPREEEPTVAEALDSRAKMRKYRARF